MARNYEVSIEGKLLRIAVEAPRGAAIAGVPVIQLTTVQDLDNVLSELWPLPGIHGAVLFGPLAEKAWDHFRSRYAPVLAAGGAVTDERGRLLAIHRLGRWDLPKGKVDQGESLPAAAVREVREECGLQEVSIERPLCETWHTYTREGTDHLKRTEWFLMRAPGTQRLEAQASENITRVEWMDGAGVEAMKQDTYPAILTVISAWEEAVHRSRT
ncbi:MAG: NUDIX domain-containing protein [Flavobacteriales bacterium]|nr:NUDIX domain-containing protein [Flavobacteriales bacterium]